MSILGVGYIQNINLGSTDPTKVDLKLEILGIVSGNPVSTQIVTFTDSNVTVTGTTWELSIKTFIKSYLTTNFGYSFGLLDEVILIGATLI